jgi:hypothetical protein
VKGDAMFQRRAWRSHAVGTPVDENQSARWFQDARKFREYRRGIVDLVPYGRHEDQIATCVRKSRGRRFTLYECYVSWHRRLHEFVAKVGQHLGRNVHAIEFVWGDELGDGDREVAGACANIDDCQLRSYARARENAIDREELFAIGIFEALKIFGIKPSW